MYIYTNMEMHRFGRNAENPGVCVYKEKEKARGVNIIQLTDTVEHKKFSKIHAATHSYSTD